MFDLASFEFWFIFCAIVLVMFFKMRNKRVSPNYRGKAISIRGERISTGLSLQTPLVCLLDDGKNYGEDYQIKEPPQLPHNELCDCILERIHHREEEWFQEKLPSDWRKEFDYQNPAPAHRRFLKYYLIANHSEGTESIIKDYQELLKNSPLDLEVQKQIIDSIHQSH